MTHSHTGIRDGDPHRESIVTSCTLMARIMGSCGTNY